MGIRKRGKKNRHKEGEPYDQRSKERGSYRLTTAEDKQNEMFEKYYKEQGLMPPDQWETFMESLRRELPTSFRLIGCKTETESLLRLIMQRYVSNFDSVASQSDVPIAAPQEIPWYPNGLAFQMSLPRTVIRKNALLSQFHNFLVTETELGNISRQETVSMIPPLLMDIEPHHKVLDMCAAPGSKTAQIIEKLHSDQTDAVPEGFLVANDSDNARCYMLVRQSLKRLPSASVLVTNHDASQMPAIKLGEAGGEIKNVLYDRILCDVICSGDGTFRKNLGIWKSWTPAHAYGLHNLQLRIARRGLELLAVDGLMVYSTCSLNPAENEAVISNLLEGAGGSVELVDVSERLGQLNRDPGVCDWKIMDKIGNFYKSQSEVPESFRSKVPQSVFPPDEQKAKDFHLERCMRILPHHQDTGGFFVAVLRKTAHLPGFKEPASKPYHPPPAKKRKGIVFKENPFVFMEQEDERWTEMRRHYGFSDTFAHTQMLSRSIDQQPTNNLYFVSRAVKQILVNNQHNLKVINAGVRVFGRVEQKYEQCRFRLAQEGLPLIYPYMSARVVSVPQSDMIVMLVAKRNCKLELMSAEARDRLDAVSEGSVCVGTDKDGQTLSVCAWKGKWSINAYAAKEIRLHYLRILGHDTTAIEEELVAKRKGNKQTTNEAEGGETKESDTKESVIIEETDVAACD